MKTDANVGSAEAVGKAFRVYWICGSLKPSEADITQIQQQGGAVQVMDSLEELGMQAAFDQDVPGLIVVELPTALTDAMRAYCEFRQRTSVPAMPLVVLGTEVTEADMMRCMHLGALKIASRTHAAQSVCEIADWILKRSGSSLGESARQVRGIRAQAAMDRMQADQEFFSIILRYFFDELPQHRQALHEAWSGELEKFQHRCHSLKGLALTVGIEQLAEVARQGESMGPHLEGTEIENQALLHQLNHEIQSARFDILRWLSMNQQTGATTP